MCQIIMAKRKREVDIYVDVNVDFGEDYGKVELVKDRKVPFTNEMLAARGNVFHALYGGVIKAASMQPKVMKVVLAGTSTATKKLFK